MILDYKRIIHFLFPPSEDELQISHTSIEDFMSIGRTSLQESVTTLLPYSDARVRSAVHLLKFHNHTQAKKLLGAVLLQYIHITTPSDSILIPIPLSSKRLRERGYNQVTEVLHEALQSDPSRKLRTNILTRSRHTVPQTSLSREQRLHNMAHAFAIKNIHTHKATIAGKHVILVDDVMTTGATLKAAKAALLPLGAASITCVALAH